MSPSPNRYHQEISKNLEFIIHAHVKHQGLGKVYYAPFDVYLTEHDVFQPDLLFVSKDRHSILTLKGVEGAPDLVVEILSPNSIVFDRGKKLSTYAQNGVIEYWILDPDKKTVEVFSFKEAVDRPKAIYHLGRNTHFQSDLLPGLSISLEAGPRHRSA